MKTHEKPIEEVSRARTNSALFAAFCLCRYFRNFLKSVAPVPHPIYDDFGKGWEEDFYAWPAQRWNENGSAIGGTSAG